MKISHSSPARSRNRSDVVAGPLVRELVDLLVVVVAVADVDADPLQPGLEQRVPARFVEQRGVARHRAREALFADPLHERRRVAVEQRLAQAAQADRRGRAGRARGASRAELDDSGRAPARTRLGRHQALVRRRVARAEVALGVAPVRRLDVDAERHPFPPAFPRATPAARGLDAREPMMLPDRIAQSSGASLGVRADWTGDRCGLCARSARGGVLELGREFGGDHHHGPGDHRTAPARPRRPKAPTRPTTPAGVDVGRADASATSPGTRASPTTSPTPDRPASRRPRSTTSAATSAATAA